MNDDANNSNDTSNKNNRNFVPILMVFGKLSLIWISLFGLLYWWQINQRVLINGQVTGLRDSLEYFKDKYGREVAKTDLLSLEQLKLLDQKDSLVTVLNKIRKHEKINKPGEAIIIANTITSVDTGIVGVDSIYLNSDSSATYVYSLSSEFGKWISGKLVANKDSLLLTNFRVTNEYTFIIHKKRGFKYLFKEPSYSISIINNNPYTTTVDLGVYAVRVPPVKRGYWFLAGLGIGLGVTNFLNK